VLDTDDNLMLHLVIKEPNIKQKAQNHNGFELLNPSNYPIKLIQNTPSSVQKNFSRFYRDWV